MPLRMNHIVVFVLHVASWLAARAHGILCPYNAIVCNKLNAIGILLDIWLDWYRYMTLIGFVLDYVAYVWWNLIEAYNVSNVFYDMIINFITKYLNYYHIFLCIYIRCFKFSYESNSLEMFIKKSTALFSSIYYILTMSQIILNLNSRFLS